MQRKKQEPKKVKPLTGWEKENLKGKVKYMLKKSYYATDSAGKLLKLRMDGQYNDSIVFDEKGNKTGYYYFYSIGNLIAHFTYEYDTARHELTCKKFDSAGRMYEKWESSYDVDGYRGRYIQNDSNSNILSFEDDKWDHNGNNYEMSIFIMNDHHDSSRFVSKFDERGNKLEMQHFYNGNLEYTWKYSYDKNDSLISRGLIDSVGKIGFHDDNTYDEKGNKIAEKYYNKDGIAFEIMRFKVDDKGRTVEKSDSLYTTLRVYRLEYDAAGNWIRDICYLREHPTSVTERKIVYYP